LAYLHVEKVIHRDLKSDNVLMLNGRCKLTDFGSSSKHTDTRRPDSLCEVRGTLVYLAPEMSIERFQVTFSSDVYSFGILLWELFNTLAVKAYQTPYHTLMPSLRRKSETSVKTREHVRKLKLDGEGLNLADDDKKATAWPVPSLSTDDDKDSENNDAECEGAAQASYANDDAKVDYALFVLIANGVRPDVPRNFLKRAMALYVNCVGSDPRNRPKVGDVLRHLESWQKHLTANTATTAHVRPSESVLASSSGGPGWDEVTAQEVPIRLQPVSDL
jgi:serine/threonine protein kinase